MEKEGKLKALLAILVCCVLLSSVAFAGPDQGGPGGDRGGQRGPRGGFDRAAMQERMMNMMKERMGASDEEWTIIQPRLQEVMEIQRNAMGGGMRAMFGRGRGDQNTETPTEPVEVASKELQDTLEKESPTTAEIKAKLAALRGAREKNKQKLVTAQQKLKEVLSVKQEAMLVMMGMLE